VTSRLERNINSKTFSIIMFTCIVGFVLFKRFHRDLGDVLFFVAFLGTAFSIYFNFKSIKKDPIFIAFFVSLIIPVLSWLNSIVFIPELAKDTPDPFLLYKFFVFWFIAYWTKGDKTRIACILFAFCVSVIGIFTSHAHDLIGEIIQGIKGARIDLDLVNAQYTSLFSGFGLLAAIFLPFTNTPETKSVTRYLKNGAAIAMAAFFFLIVIISQSRQVWVSIFLCLLVAPIALWSPKLPKRWLVASYAVLFMFFAALSTSSIVTKRLQAESSTIEHVINLDVSAISENSVGLRVEFWIEAWDWIKARPLLGSGDDARRLVISESDRFSPQIRSEFTHLHNSHVETFVHFGVVGALLIYFVILYPVVRVYTQNAESISNVWKTFALMALILWMVVNCFESFFYAADGIYIFAVFFGVIYSFKFMETEPRHLQKEERDVTTEKIA
tara:strand:- start:743 stop:2068 length:1326 start_codon:yes stop_codon:yes gene_type:complete